MRWVQIYLKLNNKGIFYSQSPATTECGWGWRGMNTTRQAATQYKIKRCIVVQKNWKNGEGQERRLLLYLANECTLHSLDLRRDWSCPEDSSRPTNSFTGQLSHVSFGIIIMRRTTTIDCLGMNWFDRNHHPLPVQMNDLLVFPLIIVDQIRRGSSPFYLSLNGWWTSESDIPFDLPSPLHIPWHLPIFHANLFRL